MIVKKTNKPNEYMIENLIRSQLNRSNSEMKIYMPRNIKYNFSYGEKYYN